MHRLLGEGGVGRVVCGYDVAVYSRKGSGLGHDYFQRPIAVMWQKTSVLSVPSDTAPANAFTVVT